MAAVSLNQRIDANTCIRCRKKLGKGDRVTVAHIIAEVTSSLDLRGAGAVFSEEFEITHIDCGDPTLSKPGVASLGALTW